MVDDGGGEDGGFGYHSAEADDLARYILIEWSAPSRRNMPDENEATMPSEAAAWLAAYRQKTHERNKVKYERFLRRWNDNIDDFAEVLAGCDRLLITEVYAAGETPIATADGRAICRAIRSRGQVMHERANVAQPA